MRIAAHGALVLKTGGAQDQEQTLAQILKWKSAVN
jgi:hypothetical protein